MKMLKDPNLYNTNEVAQLLNVSVNDIERLVYNKQLKPTVTHKEERTVFTKGNTIPVFTYGIVYYFNKGYINKYVKNKTGKGVMP